MPRGIVQHVLRSLRLLMFTEVSGLNFLPQRTRNVPHLNKVLYAINNIYVVITMNIIRKI